MESFLLTTSTSNPLLIDRNYALLSSSASSFSSTISTRVEIRRSRIEKVTTTKTSSTVASSVSNRGTRKGCPNNVVLNDSVVRVAADDVPEVSWKDLQYPAGSIGHRKPLPPVVDKDKQMEYIKKILGSKVYDVAVETPLQLAPLLSTQMGSNLWLKREDSQQV